MIWLTCRRVAGCTAALLTAALLTGTAGTATAGAVSASAGRPPSASGDAGYAVTGTRLLVAESWVTLPNPARFARELGAVTASVQLWTPHEVFDLRVTACTDAGCRPGGKGLRRDYHAVLGVYDRASRVLICSTAAAGAKRCPQVGSFGRGIAPGRRVELYLDSPVPYLWLFAGAGSTYGYALPGAVAGKPRDFTQARIGVELGPTPWSRPAIRKPPATMAIMSFDRPKPPPFFAEIVNLNGTTGGIAARSWRHYRVRTSPRSPFASPGPLWDEGYGLTVYLRR
jgi:hypothetical protein